MNDIFAALARFRDRFCDLFRKEEHLCLVAEGWLVTEECTCCGRLPLIPISYNVMSDLFGCAVLRLFGVDAGFHLFEAFAVAL